VASSSIKSRIDALLAPAAEEHGFELVAVEVSGPNNGRLVRVYIEKEDGVDLDALASANEWISTLLDAEDLIDGAYVLEVSSPGIDRPLARSADYVRFAGEEVTLRTAMPIDGRRTFIGILEGMSGDDVLIDCQGTSSRIPFTDIAKAHINGQVDFGND